MLLQLLKLLLFLLLSRCAEPLAVLVARKLEVLRVTAQKGPCMKDGGIRLARDVEALVTTAHLETILSRGS
jgi:hypothetical protein